MTSPRLALFDLDHTLLPLDSDYQWADYLARTGRAGDPDEARRRNDELMERYNRGELTAEQAAEFMLGLLAAHPPYELAAWHEAFMAEVIRPSITSAARAGRRAPAGRRPVRGGHGHQRLRHRSHRPRLRHPHLIATDAEYRHGRYTGRIHGTPSFKEGKVVRVDQWLAGMGTALTDFPESFFYSDSVNDVPLLEKVSQPVAANPSPALRKIAQERGWRVIDLFDHMEDSKS